VGRRGCPELEWYVDGRGVCEGAGHDSILMVLICAAEIHSLHARAVHR
jgi:hypothetical protein